MEKEAIIKQLNPFKKESVDVYAHLVEYNNDEYCYELFTDELLQYLKRFVQDTNLTYLPVLHYFSSEQIMPFGKFVKSRLKLNEGTGYCWYSPEDNTVRATLEYLSDAEGVFDFLPSVDL